MKDRKSQRILAAMKPNGIAFDRASARSIDADGRLHVAKTHISKANVCPYYGKEIPGWQELGLEPNKVYRLWRAPEELAKGASTFNNLPLLRRHVQVSATDPMKDDVVGSIGSDVTYDAPYLDASLCVWDAEAIAGIDADKIAELSCGYRYTADMTPGTTPEGEAYDGVMRDIIGNHLALVEFGRAGSDVMVADADPFADKQKNPTFTHKQETPAMKKTKLGRALLAALSAASPKIAQDSALPGLVGGAVKAKFDAKSVKAKVLAMDEEMDAEKIDEIIDAVLGVEEDPQPQTMPSAVGDEDDSGAPSKHAEIIDFLKSKGMDSADLEAVGNMLTRMDRPYSGEDEGLMKPEEVDQKVTAAMDSMRQEFRALEAAKVAVRPVVGDVIAMDSAEQVYRFALDQMKVDHKDMPAAGLAKLFAVAAERKAPAPRIANDSAAVRKVFPGLDRFNQ
ncbi:hypothetical protein MAJJADAN_00020 [Pseudomonas phage Amjad_SA]|nr:hypothetical protein MAJJADAN_00020 [Pseudomonas phage Amjad_SA]